MLLSLLSGVLVATLFPCRYKKTGKNYMQYQPIKSCKNVLQIGLACFTSNNPLYVSNYKIMYLFCQAVL